MWRLCFCILELRGLWLGFLRVDVVFRLVDLILFYALDIRNSCQGCQNIPSCTNCSRTEAASSAIIVILSGYFDNQLTDPAFFCTKDEQERRALKSKKEVAVHEDLMKMFTFANDIAFKSRTMTLILQSYGY